MARPARNPPTRSTTLNTWQRSIGPLLLLAGGLMGCSMSMTIAPATSRPDAEVALVDKPAKRIGEKPAVRPKSEYLPDAVMEGGATKAPVVNVFGEFQRNRKGSAMLVGDPSLKQHTFTDSGYDADVTIDPSGKWLAFTSARDGERTQIYLQGVDSPAVTQLTNDAADNAQPIFSPDGRRIAFCSNRSGSWHLYLMNSDGRNVAQITDGPGNEMHPSFSPDGTRLVYSSSGGAGEAWQLFIVDLVTRAKTAIGYGLFPSWSPEKDRDVIAFQKTRARGSRWFSLWTCELKNGEAGEVTEIAVSSNAALVSPSWSPDGKMLAFATIVEPAQMRNGKPQGQQDIWVIDADGSNRRRVTDGTATNLTPFWGVDYRVYFVSDRSGHECIWSLPTTSAALRENEATASRQNGAASPRPAQKKEMEPSSAATDPNEIKP